MREVLACIPDETAVPLSEVGHSAECQRRQHGRSRAVVLLIAG
ncbi:MAG TPA: hypothetical protein VE400_03040 [Mycobacterium sp.]|nr:hypothetical protein [Mycobacterium sp.]